MEAVSTPQRQKIHPHKFTLWVAIGSIIMMFAGLTSAYIVKSSQANWVEVTLPKAFWFSTAVILLSSVTMQLAVRAFKARAFARYRTLLVVTLVLGLAFVAIQYAGFYWLWNNGVRLTGSGAGQFLYPIAGLHAVHVIGGVIALLIIFARAFIGRTKSYNAVPVEVMATYWHFVDILWIYLLVFLAWIG
jgi:cytochrome c oxidase subunit 3